MESKWAFNVANYGIGGIGATVAARRLVLPAQYLTNVPGSNPNTFVTFRIPLIPGAPYEMGEMGKQPGHPHFPYGYALWPDELP